MNISAPIPSRRRAAPDSTDVCGPMTTDSQLYAPLPQPYQHPFRLKPKDDDDGSKSCVFSLIPARQSKSSGLTVAGIRTMESWTTSGRVSMQLMRNMFQSVIQKLHPQLLLLQPK